MQTRPRAKEGDRWAPRTRSERVEIDFGAWEIEPHTQRIDFDDV